MVMRRFDVWVGRIAAIVGIVYVLMASLWPLAASANDGETKDDAISSSIDIDREMATIEFPPMDVALVDIRIGRVIAEVVGRRERDDDGSAKKSRKRSVACPALARDGCDEASSMPDSSTLTVLLIPMAALALATASTLRVRGRPIT